MKNNEMLVKAMKALAVASDALVEYVEGEEAKDMGEPETPSEDGFVLTCLIHKVTNLPCCLVQKVLDFTEMILAKDEELTICDVAPLVKAETGLSLKEIKAVIAAADKIIMEANEDE